MKIIHYQNLNLFLKEKLNSHIIFSNSTTITGIFNNPEVLNFEILLALKLKIVVKERQTTNFVITARKLHKI